MVQHPDIDRLLATPEAAAAVALSEVPKLLAQLGSLQLRVAGLEAALLARLHSASSDQSGAGDRLLDIEAVAEVLGVPVAHAREMRRRRELPIVRVGRYVKVREASLRAWLRQHEELGDAPRREYHARPKRTAGTPARVVPLRQSEDDR